MSKSPQISVIIPTLNESDNIERAIDSVLQQSEKGVEIVICDAGSTDDTREIVSSINSSAIKLFVDETGLISQMNTMCEEADGKYLAVLDADSIMLPGRLKKQKNILERAKNTAAVGTALRYRDHCQNAVYTLDAPIDSEIKWQAIRTNPINHTTAMLRKKSVMSEGGYSDRPFGDYDLMIRLAKDWEIRNIDEVLTETLERPSRGGRDFSPLTDLYHNTMIGIKAINTMNWDSTEYPLALTKRLGTSIKLAWKAI